eukprot:SM000010S04262  [mRNA]  locus=s10:594185:594799:+ [translate_table: standard]
MASWGLAAGGGGAAAAALLAAEKKGFFPRGGLLDWLDGAFTRESAIGGERDPVLKKAEGKSGSKQPTPKKPAPKVRNVHLC